MIWSIACMAKFQVMNSTIGRKPGERGADAEPGEAMFGDRRVDHAPRAELFEQALADFVGALILRDFLAHQEDGVVAAHLFGHRVAQGLAHGHGHQLGALGNLGIAVHDAAGSVGARTTAGFAVGLRVCAAFGLRFGFGRRSGSGASRLLTVAAAAWRWAG